MAVIRARPSQCQVALLSVVFCILACPAMMAAALENQTGQVTVFWGRHKDEGSLREACDSGMYTRVIMSFLNLYGHGVYHLDLSGHRLAGIGEDIKHCQLVGVLVSLSVRGNFSLPSNQSALDLVDYVWNAYLGGDRKGVHRPFGNAKLDGIDLFLEQGTPAAKPYDDMLAMELAKVGMGTENGKPAFPLTATLPSSAIMNHPTGRGAVTMGIYERIHVRFFDDGGNSVYNAYSQEVWDRWAAAYPSSRIFLGLAASPEAAKEGYLYPKSLYYGVLPVVQKAANYGGVMLWDRFYDKSGNYSSYVKRWA